MENAAKALEMAAGVLLAILIMALISYFFTNIKNWPEEEDQIKQAEQLTEFNKEYEVYEKSLMYGTDVISCLNKVKNNNVKYVQGFGFTYGTSYNTFSSSKNEYTYLINVSIKLKTPLKESISVYYNSALSKQEDILKSLDQIKEGWQSTSLEDIGFKNLNNSATGGKYYTLFNKTDKLSDLYSSDGRNNHNEHDLTGEGYMSANKTYEFFNVNNRDVEINEEITTLLQMTDNMAQSVHNRNVRGYGDWTSATWNTAAYYFKQKRFKCTKIEYNSSTNRISKIIFEETD